MRQGISESGTAPRVAGPVPGYRRPWPEGEGSTGSLDLFADVLVNGGSKDGSYFQHVLPELSAGTTAKPVKKRERQGEDLRRDGARVRCG